MSDGPIIYGKSEIYWCNNCNVPLIQEECNECGFQGEKINLTPPGDISPSFGKRKLIKNLIEEEYGIEGRKFLPDNKIVLINPVPALDDAYEFIMDGMILGQLRYEPEKNDWRILLKIEGAIKLYLLGVEKNIVKVDKEAGEYIRNGRANALAPGVIDSDFNIDIKDECIVVERSEERKREDVLATGLAKMSGKEMVDENYGVSVKTRKQKEVKYKNLKGNQSWEDVIEANKAHLNQKINETTQFMKNISNKKDLPIAIAFSGGKDSLAVLLLALKVFKKNEFEIIFNNTGLEFPETLEYINKIEKKVNKDIKRASAKDKFWESLDDFGPLGKDYRWCCKTSKLGPLSNFIESNYKGKGNKVLVFGGERKFESQSRYNRGRTWKNPWIPGEFGASPIKHWRALEVWLLIFQGDLPYNKLYKNFDRIGCWLCPSSSLAEINYVKKTHPKMWKKFRSKLNDFAEKNDLPKEWITHGLWRWKDLPKGQEKLAKDLGLMKKELDHERSNESIKLVDHEKDKNTDKLSEKVDFEELEKVLPILGDYELVEDNESTSIDFKKKNLTIGKDYLQGDQKERKKASQVIKKAFECVQCKVCISICPKDAIKLNGSGIKVKEGCVSCEQCLDPCPLSLK